MLRERSFFLAGVDKTLKNGYNKGCNLILLWRISYRMKKYRTYLLDLLFICLGCLALAVGVNLFLTPGKLSSGGVSTLCTVLLHLFGFRMSLTNLAANVVLFAVGFRYLGKYALVKTAEGILLLSLFLELTSYLPVFTGDTLLATVMGGVLVGVGVGLVVRREASTGGSDFAALIIKRLIPHVSLAHIILVIDCAVIVLAGVVFKSLSVTVYSIIAMFICSRVADAIVTVGDAAKAVQIFSPKAEEISCEVLERMDRGVTGLHCRGMYSGKEGLMLLCVVSPKELPSVINLVRSIDRTAFIVVNDSREVLGEGFKETSNYD